MQLLGKVIELLTIALDPHMIPCFMATEIWYPFVFQPGKTGDSVERHRNQQQKSKDKT